MTSVAEQTTSFERAQYVQTLDAIASDQRESGMIPWSPSQHCDPWNHVEAAMALTAGGRFDCAALAYTWLGSIQHPDGSWYASYWVDGSAKDRHLDTNATAYIATGLYHYLCESEDEAFVAQLLPVVDRAVEFVLSHQFAWGGIAWSVEPCGVASGHALVAASSSIFQSLVAACELARHFGLGYSRWQNGALRLAEAVTARPAGFLAKDEFAMDWYYPVLAGVIGGAEARLRLDASRTRYVVEGHGVLCRSDQRWVTTAETAEFAIALARAGYFDQAREMFSEVRAARDEAGRYATGIVYPEGVEFPVGERTSYSSAAVILAEDFLRGGIGTTSVFTLQAGAVARQERIPFSDVPTWR